MNWQECSRRDSYSVRSDEGGVNKFVDSKLAELKVHNKIGTK